MRNWAEIMQTRMPDSHRVGSTYMLPHDDVEKLIMQSGGVALFVSELSQELESVYADAELLAENRTGFTEGYSTLEWMGCTGPDYRVGKWIGSAPNASVTVSGSMFLYKRGQAGEVLSCDAGLLTALRTATTTTLVLGKLKPDLTTLSVIGAGQEGRTHASVAALLLPNLGRVFFRDIDPGRAKEAAEEFVAIAEQLGPRPDGSFMTAEAVGLEDRRVELEADAIVTATLAQEEVLSDTQFKENIVIAAVGGDMVGKQELSTAIYGQAKFVTDELRQSLKEGELQHAAKELGIEPAAAEEVTYHGSLLGGRVIGITNLLHDPESFKRRPEPITVYDSTGFAGQDLAVGRLMMRLLKEQSWPQVQFHPPRRMSFSELARAGRRAGRED